VPMVARDRREHRNRSADHVRRDGADAIWWCGGCGVASFALAEMTDALSRLDHKYKAMVAKASFGCSSSTGGAGRNYRRTAAAEDAGKIEIERLNEELKNICNFICSEWARAERSAAAQGMARDVRQQRIVSSPVEARTMRR